ncbi:MAG: GC-type dockerin domain-anchored protein [Phycisphaerales bacterium]
MTRQSRQSIRLIALAGACAYIGTARAQVIEVDYSAPTLDRWSYPFNGSPGTRLSASTFGAIELEGFDDHDAQLILGFDTFNEITASLDPSAYQILSATITITNTNADEFRYDSTYDTHDTYLYQDESLDLDPGRPVHLWAVGYRNDYDQSTYGEYTVFGGVPSVEPVQEARNAFAAYFPDGVTPTDISNNLKQEFDANPMAIGQVDTLATGDLVPADTTFVFDVDLCDPGYRAYLTDELAFGEMRFAVSSLHTASGGDGGGTGDIQYPFWYTRENPIAQLLGYTPTLHLRVRIGSPGDYNGDGIYDFFDVSAFLSDFTSGTLDADLSGDCVLDFFDVSAFLSAFAAG